jgi:hypothetical protein
LELLKPVHRSAEGFESSSDLSAGLGETSGAAEIFAQALRGTLMPYSHSGGSEGSTTTWHFVYHIGHCYSHKICYIIIWHVLSKSLNIFTYGDTGITEMDSVIESIYSGDPWVDRHHQNTHSFFASSWSHAQLPRIHSSAQFVWFLTHSCQAFIGSQNLCRPSWPGIPSYQVTHVLHSSSHNGSIVKNSLPMVC